MAPHPSVSYIDAPPVAVLVTVPLCQRSVPPRAAVSATDAATGVCTPGIAETRVPMRSAWTLQTQK